MRLGRPLAPAPGVPRWRRPWRIALVVCLAVALLAAGYLARQIVLVGNGYVAKMVCSGVFVSERLWRWLLELAGAPEVTVTRAEAGEEARGFSFAVR